MNIFLSRFEQVVIYHGKHSKQQHLQQIQFLLMKQQTSTTKNSQTWNLKKN